MYLTQDDPLVALQHALADHQFQLTYQPQIDCRNNRIVGAEALLVWHHPQHGPLSPPTFFPTLTPATLIELEDWIFVTACQQYSGWQQQGFPPLHYAINLSSYYLQHPNCFSKLISFLSNVSLPLEYLTVELTETNQVENPLQLQETLSQLREIGIQIALDDFGTGYNNLQSLIWLQVDYLKIPKELISDIEISKNQQSLLQCTLQLADDFDLAVITEGIETSAQSQFLLARGCEIQQGFYFSKNLSAPAFQNLLIKREEPHAI